MSPTKKNVFHFVLSCLINHIRVKHGIKDVREECFAHYCLHFKTKAKITLLIKRIQWCSMEHIQNISWT